ncbi:hypothetical protein M3661_29550 [Paenibacillus sp. MER 180]|uniref:hypothetical protein n=1 Tax=Paenibacillus sp. MER 180 TaxID=2939570 RepID=UPI00203D5EA9|nr:hypothetical protein [Paenibacillus sp. MER 180]MCM3294235.1 hypothetical protein [Paenibacillus sp. MER 180]
MKSIIKRMICGGKWLKLWTGVRIRAWMWQEEFIVPLVEVSMHQWYKQSKRLNKLMTAGRRCRGDVGVQA